VETYEQCHDDDVESGLYVLSCYGIRFMEHNVDAVSVISNMYDATLRPPNPSGTVKGLGYKQIYLHLGYLPGYSSGLQLPGNAPYMKLLDMYRKTVGARGVLKSGCLVNVPKLLKAYRDILNRNDWPLLPCGEKKKDQLPERAHMIYDSCRLSSKQVPVSVPSRSATTSFTSAMEFTAGLAPDSTPVNHEGSKRKVKKRVSSRIDGVAVDIGDSGRQAKKRRLSPVAPEDAPGDIESREREVNLRRSSRLRAGKR
jgi:hypothetical protein